MLEFWKIEVAAAGVPFSTSFICSITRVNNFLNFYAILSLIFFYKIEAILGLTNDIIQDGVVTIK